jgi:hypothetical protein
MRNQALVGITMIGMIQTQVEMLTIKEEAMMRTWRVSLSDPEGYYHVAWYFIVLRIHLCNLFSDEAAEAIFPVDQHILPTSSPFKNISVRTIFAWHFVYHQASSIGF